MDGLMGSLSDGPPISYSHSQIDRWPLGQAKHMSETLAALQERMSPAPLKL